MKQHISLIALLFISGSLFSQQTKPVRYKDAITNKVHVQKDIIYNNDESIKIKQRQMDFYEPANDSSTQKRLLIIWLHGGGFKFGSKNANEIKLWSNQFAKRGYVVAALNYRLSKKHPIKKFPDLVDACYDNIEDVQHAVNYFKTNSSKLNIDTSKIILGGNSAGAVIALQTVYSNRADEQNVIDSNKITANTINYNPLKIAAVINFWGALFDDDWLSRTNILIVSVCGAKDKIVRPDTKGVAFFGSIAINRKADALHIKNDIKLYKNYGHELQAHFNPLFRSSGTKKRWKEAADFSSDFLYNALWMNK